VKSFFRALSVAMSMAVTATFLSVTAFADSGISNPLAGKSGSIASILNTVISWVLGAVSALAGAWFLFHLFKAVLGFMAGSNHAQRREEAKSHLVHVAISGVLLGAIGVVAAALYNFGSSLH